MFWLIGQNVHKLLYNCFKVNQINVLNSVYLLSGNCYRFVVSCTVGSGKMAPLFGKGEFCSNQVIAVIREQIISFLSAWRYDDERKIYRFFMMCSISSIACQSFYKSWSLLPALLLPIGLLIRTPLGVPLPPYPKWYRLRSLLPLLVASQKLSHTMNSPRLMSKTRDMSMRTLSSYLQRSWIR